MSESWLKMSQDTRRVAVLLVRDHARSCVSRAYYAAYCRVTHELAEVARLTPPPRGNWSHARTRTMIRTDMPGLTPDERRRLSDLFNRLLALREAADYQPTSAVDAREARAAVSLLNEIGKLL